MDDDTMRRLCARVFTEQERWPAVGDYRPDDLHPLADFTPDDDHRQIFDLAILPGGDDTLGMLCREVIRLRVELDELRGAVGLGRN